MRARKGAVDPFRKSGLRNFYDKVLVAEWCKAGLHQAVARPNFLSVFATADYEPWAYRAGSMPTYPLMSAYQTLPSGSTARL